MRVARAALAVGGGEAHLDKLEALGKDYVGRRLYLLYNPLTGRTNGTTPNFFATMTIRPPKIVDRPHRHVSAAINYYFSRHRPFDRRGQGLSVEGGRPDALGARLGGAQPRLAMTSMSTS